MPNLSVGRVADLVGVSDHTVRRWSTDYQIFLSPLANPGKGAVRSFTAHDVNVLSFVATLKTQGREQSEIENRLKELQKDNWDSLPVVDLPDDPDQMMPVTEAQARAYELAHAAALRVELQHIQRELEAAHTRVEELEQQLKLANQHTAGVNHQLAQTQRETGEKIHQLEIDLAAARGQVAALEGQLRAFSVAGRPISPVVLVGLVALVAVVVTVILLLVGRLI